MIVMRIIEPQGRAVHGDRAMALNWQLCLNTLCQGDKHKLNIMIQVCVCYLTSQPFPSIGLFFSSFYFFFLIKKKGGGVICLFVNVPKEI